MRMITRRWERLFLVDEVGWQNHLSGDTCDDLLVPSYRGHRWLRGRVRDACAEQLTDSSTRGSAAEGRAQQKAGLNKSKQRHTLTQAIYTFRQGRIIDRSHEAQQAIPDFR